MAVFDILLNNSQELQATTAGDFLCDDASNNYIKYLLLSSPGAYKLYPLVGIGIQQFINANASPVQIARAIRLQLENDIFKSPRINTDKFPVITINQLQITL